MKERYLYYAAYGSNLNMEQMSRRCGDAVPVGKGYIQNWRLCFKGSGSGNYLTIEKSKGHKVPVVIWKVSKSDIQSLNCYEGFPTFYDIHRFKKVQVEGFIGETADLGCFAYVMIGNRAYGLPTPNYYLTCAEGYRRFGIDEQFLEEALKFTEEKKHDMVHTSRGH